jgi:hypothetical protein
MHTWDTYTLQLSLPARYDALLPTLIAIRSLYQYVNENPATVHPPTLVIKHRIGIQVLVNAQNSCQEMTCLYEIQLCYIGRMLYFRQKDNI